MKKYIFKIIILINIIFFSTLSLISCDKVTIPGRKLNTPVVELIEDIAKWQTSTNAKSYEILIDSEVLTVDNTVSSKKLEDGQSLKVRAIGDGILFLDSDWSNTVTYEEKTNEEITPIKLQTPIVSISEIGLASWNKIPNATKYSYKINSESEKETTELSLQLNDGDSITIKAIGDSISYVNSDWSNTVTYEEKTNEEITPIKLQTPIVSISEIGLASWNEIPNATKYSYKINSESEKETTELSLQLNDGDSITIKAIGDGISYVNSDWSSVVKYNETGKPGIKSISITEAIEMGENLNSGEITTLEYEVTGIVDEITNTKYGNMYIADDYGNKILIYGLYSQDGTRYDGMSVKPEVGNKIVVTSQITNYNGTPELISATLISITGPTQEESTSKVNFFMINDTHGAFLDSSDSVSIGRVDTLIDELTKTNGEYIKIHNGDAFQGSYVCGVTYGLPLIESLNIMEFDCFVLGNHEFDWGIDKIAQYADGNLANGEANFPFLGANIYYKGTTTRPDWIKPYTVVDYDNIKVGIIGVMGPDQESSILTRYIKDYEFVSPINIIKQYSLELREELDCDVVVVATHEYDENLNDSIAQLPASSYVDSIFCAHTHQKISQKLTRNDGVLIPVVQNWHKNNTASSVSINLDENNNMISGYSNHISPQSYAISSDIQALINKYQSYIDDSNLVLGNTSQQISKDRLGSYATDAMINYIYNESMFDGEIDMAIMNTGGIRATIDSGQITKADIFEVFPFNNMVILVNIDGASLKSIYNKNSNYLYVDFAQGISSINNLKDSEIYQLAIIDYVFESTHSSYDAFDKLNNDQYIETNIIMRDILIQYLDELY